jgi:GNAT superfamily N-acetyltransferase
MNTTASVYTRQASVADLDLVAPLFDAYRIFYGKPSDVALARAFLQARFQHHQSVIFIAQAPDGAALGFSQLYPSFSSVSAARIFILNDLYVVAQARRTGVAVSLLDAAAEYARAVGAIGLTLSTGVDNTSAQALYASLGWVRETAYFEFSLQL